MKVNFLWMVVSSVFVLAACGPSEEEAFHESERNLRAEILSDEAEEPNLELDGFSIFLPEELEVSDSRGLNVVFTDDHQPYILFINEFEEPTSQWLYDQLPEEDEVYLSTVVSDDAFSYLLIQDREEETYELSVGIGGIKMSTMTDVSTLAEDTELMTRMIRSIEVAE